MDYFKVIRRMMGWNVHGALWEHSKVTLSTALALWGGFQEKTIPGLGKGEWKRRDPRHGGKSCKELPAVHCGEHKVPSSGEREEMWLMRHDGARSWNALYEKSRNMDFICMTSATLWCPCIYLQSFGNGINPWGKHLWPRLLIASPF